MGSSDKYLFVFVIIAIIAVPLGFFIWDRLYLRRRTRNVISAELKEEIEEEREGSRKKKELFEKTLDEARKR